MAHEWLLQRELARQLRQGRATQQGVAVTPYAHL
jgi:hypothetical protein